jgi:type IV pilus assembly protein PilC
MPVFTYTAFDSSGKRVNGEIEANDRNDAIRRLIAQGLTPLNVEPKGGKTPRGGATPAPTPQPAPKESEEKKGGGFKLTNIPIPFLKGGASSKDLSILAKQLAALVEAGVGIVDALELVADSITNKTLKKVLVEISQEIREGTSLSKALEKRQDIFGEFFIRMIEVGEETGALDRVLYKISEYYKGIAEIINKIKSASFYPAFVLTTAGGITFAIIYFLVPTFAQIYKSFGAALPAPTQMLVNASDWLQANIGKFLLGLIIFVASFTILYKRVYKFRRAIHWLQLRLPLLGALFKKGALAKFSRTFATLFSAGVPIERALELSAKVAGNLIYQEALEQVQQSVVHGEPLWKSLEKTGVFPQMLIAMVKIGEETGRLDTMLESLADFYEDEVKTTIEGLISMIEPLMMALIGAIVGGILIALYLPIFKIGELIQKG